MTETRQRRFTGTSLSYICLFLVTVMFYTSASVSDMAFEQGQEMEETSGDFFAF